MLIRSIDQKKQMKQLGQTYNPHRLANQMRRYFLPASTFPAPGSTRGATGNRNTSGTANNASNTTPTDNAVITLVAGVGKYTFATNFTEPPTVTATPIGTASSGVITVQGFGSTNGVIIKSTDSSDTRQVMLHMIQTVG